MRVSRWTRFPWNALCAAAAFALSWAVAAGVLTLCVGGSAAREWSIDGAIVVLCAGVAIVSSIEARRTGEKTRPFLGFLFFLSLFETCTRIPDVLALRQPGLMWLAILAAVWSHVTSPRREKASHA